MSYFGAYFSSYFDVGAQVAQPPRPQRSSRTRTLVRSPRRLVRRLIETPEGPLEVLVPDPFDETDLLVLLAAVS